MSLVIPVFSDEDEEEEALVLFFQSRRLKSQKAAADWSTFGDSPLVSGQEVQIINNK